MDGCFTGACLHVVHHKHSGMPVDSTILIVLVCCLTQCCSDGDNHIEYFIPRHRKYRQTELRKAVVIHVLKII